MLHLLYARFISYVLHDLGLTPTPEPFKRLLTQGMVHGRTLVSAKTGQWLRPDQVEPAAVKGEVEVEKATGLPVQVTRLPALTGPRRLAALACHHRFAAQPS